VHNAPLTGFEAVQRDRGRVHPRVMLATRAMLQAVPTAKHVLMFVGRICGS
jgi:hypothetical protein